MKGTHMVRGKQAAMGIVIAGVAITTSLYYLFVSFNQIFCSNQGNTVPNPTPAKQTIAQGQPYTAHDVLSSIDQVNRCDAHPVRCRDGLIELAIQLKGVTDNSSAIGHIAEVGVFQGGFSKWQAKLWAPHAKLDAVYHLIDAWQFRANDTGVDATDKNFKNDRENQYNMQQTRNNLMSVEGMNSDRFKLLREFSVPAAQSFPDEYFDYIYIDAIHSYPAALHDMQAYWPKLKRGGLFAGDDFGDNNRKDGDIPVQWNWGVRKSAKLLADELKLPLYTTISPQHQGNDALADGTPCYVFPAWYFVKP